MTPEREDPRVYEPTADGTVQVSLSPSAALVVTDTPQGLWCELLDDEAGVVWSSYKPQAIGPPGAAYSSLLDLTAICAFERDHNLMRFYADVLAAESHYRQHGPRCHYCGAMTFIRRPEVPSMWLQRVWLCTSCEYKARAA